MLVTLARRAGEIVTRNELYEEVWQGRPVTDEVLSRCVSLLRGTLGDDPKAPAYIQTIPRVGYRLVAPVSWSDTVPPGPPVAPAGTAAAGKPAPETAAPEPMVTKVRWVAGVVLVAALVVAGILASQQERDAATPVIGAGILSGTPGEAIAVLPFENLGGDAADEYFSDGLTDELITSLSRIQGLKVIARTTSFAMKGSAGDVRQVGRRLGVAKVVAGTVRVDGTRVRISAQLIDAAGGFEMWSRVYDASLDDVFEVQASIATAIVEAVIPRLRAQAVSSLSPETPNSDAHLMYLRALHILKRREEQPIRHAMTLLTRAIYLDETYGSAYVELARAYALLPFYSDESQEAMFGKAGETLALGVERGANIGEAGQSVLAFIAFSRWNWLDAEESFRRAFAYNPNDPDLYQWYSQLQASLGHVDRSLEFAKRAWELDALSPVVNDRLAVAYLWTDQDERAARFFEEADVLGLGPGANEGSHVLLLLRQRRYEELAGLVRLLQARRGGDPAWVEPFIAALADPSVADEAASAMASVGAGTIEPRHLFGALVLLGQFDRALELAMQLVVEPSSLDVEFLFSREATGLRQRPRFGELVEAIGLDRHWDAYAWPSQCMRGKDGIRCGS